MDFVMAVKSDEFVLSAVDLTREFVVHKIRPGLFGAIRGLLGGREKKRVQAVDHISFSVGKGEIVGLIGPNGAGKSTTVKMASGILKPSAGSIRTFGLDPFQERIAVARRYGVVFGQRSQLWWSLSPRETFLALAEVYELDPTEARQETSYLIEALGLGDFLDTPVRLLSLGQRVRCDIAAALIHRPEFLFLDEPTVGLDVTAKAQVRSYIDYFNRDRGVSVLLTSHDMVDVERLCSRVLVIDNGRFLYEGPLEPLRERFAPERQLVLDLEEPVEGLELRTAEVIGVNGLRVEIRFDRRTCRAMDVLGEVAANHTVVDFSVKELPIDEVIARLYQDGTGTREGHSCSA